MTTQTTNENGDDVNQLKRIKEIIKYTGHTICEGPLFGLMGPQDGCYSFADLNGVECFILKKQKNITPNQFKRLGEITIPDENAYGWRMLKSKPCDENDDKVERFKDLQYEARLIKYKLIKLPKLESFKLINKRHKMYTFRNLDDLEKSLKRADGYKEYARQERLKNRPI